MNPQKKNMELIMAMNNNNKEFKYFIDKNNMIWFNRKTIINMFGIDTSRIMKNVLSANH